MGRLQEMLRSWTDWSKNASKDENGWQSDYPQWELLMDACRTEMEAIENTMQIDYDGIEKCWQISEESEELADFAQERIASLMPILHRLARSTYPEVRWQVYAVLASKSHAGHQILTEGLLDKHPYARRRAIISLATAYPSEIPSLITRFGHDEDSLIRDYVNNL